MKLRQARKVVRGKNLKWKKKTLERARRVLRRHEVYNSYDGRKIEWLTGFFLNIYSSQLGKICHAYPGRKIDGFDKLEVELFNR